MYLLCVFMYDVPTYHTNHTNDITVWYCTNIVPIPIPYIMVPKAKKATRLGAQGTRQINLLTEDEDDTIA
jgi:hypothetical protein